MQDDYLRMVFSWAFYMRLSTLSLVRHGSYQLKHTHTATFEITPLIPISPIMETWHLVTRQKIVFKTPQRKILVPGRGGENIQFEWLTKTVEPVQTHLDNVWWQNMLLHHWEAENLDCSLMCRCFDFIILMILLEHFILSDLLECDWHDNCRKLRFYSFMYRPTEKVILHGVIFC